MRSTKLVVDVSKVRSNIAELKKNLYKNTLLMAVVKANAYGHGMLEMAHAVLANGADWLGIATPEEGMFLRENGIVSPILVLGAANGEELDLCVKYDLHQTVFNNDQILELNNIAKKYGKIAFVHIKINSGMNRIGISDKEKLNSLLLCLKECNGVVADGIFTHFATADEEDLSRTYAQISLFDDMVRVARQKCDTIKYVHACNTAGIMRGLGNAYNMVRLGVGLYGYYPSGYVKSECSFNIEPVAEFITNISAINDISKDDAVSYGATFVANNNMRIATLPVGYADGYNRLLSNKGYVIINGKIARILGKICMDQMMVDVTDIPDAEIGTKVILMGKDTYSGVSITADDLANMCMTIPYEILTSISPRVERIYI